MNRGLLVFLATSLVAAAALSGCKTAPVAVPAGLTSGELFQRAQDASDHGDYQGAMQYYTAFQERFPADTAHAAWASYEIAFLYHKLGQDATTLKLLNELLARSATAPDSFPPAVRALSEELKVRLSPPTPAKAP